MPVETLTLHAVLLAIGSRSLGFSVGDGSHLAVCSASSIRTY